MGQSQSVSSPKIRVKKDIRRLNFKEGFQVLPDTLHGGGRIPFNVHGPPLSGESPAQESQLGLLQFGEQVGDLSILDVELRRQRLVAGEATVESGEAVDDESKPCRLG